MAVDHIRDPVQIIERGQRRFPEEAVLGDIAHQVGIGIAPAEKVLVVDEVIDDAVHLHLHDADIEGSPVRAQIHHEVSAVDHLLLVLLGNAFIAGQDHLDVAVELRQGPRQGVHHVPQAAGLHKGIALRADKGHASARCGQRFGRRFRHERRVLHDLGRRRGRSFHDGCFHDRRFCDRRFCGDGRRLALRCLFRRGFLLHGVRRFARLCFLRRHGNPPRFKYCIPLLSARSGPCARQAQNN